MSNWTLEKIKNCEELCDYCKKVLSAEKLETEHGCLDCTGWIYRNHENRQWYCAHCLQNEITALKAQIASAIDVLKDFELREDHLPNCEAVAWMGGECKCMDQEYYSLRECSKRARSWLNSLKGDKIKVTEI
jgi:hypothetical protein